MRTTVQSLAEPSAKTGLATTDVDDDPPAKDNMVALGFASTSAAPLAIEVAILGSAGAVALTDAWWFGWHAQLDVAVPLAPLNQGADVEVSSAKAFTEVLQFVAGLYSHVGIGMGTLASGTLDLHVYPLEVVEG
jgi:hypothetical protein